MTPNFGMGPFGEALPFDDPPFWHGDIRVASSTAMGVFEPVNQLLCRDLAIFIARSHPLRRWGCCKSYIIVLFCFEGDLCRNDVFIPHVAMMYLYREVNKQGGVINVYKLSYWCQSIYSVINWCVRQIL
jgi:hypothetical protein